MNQVLKSGLWQMGDPDAASIRRCNPNTSLKGFKESDMTSKPDISSERLLPWDEYKSKQPDQALPSIYSRVEDASAKIRKWYWTSIKTKRWTSLFVRFFAFLLLILGTALPILAGMQETVDARLHYTQYAVAFLAMAGLLQVADKVFGWSSGWMRYVTTVTAMENLTRTFELEWAKYLIDKAAPPDMVDMKALFELARAFEQEILKLQSDETGKWVSEFNAGISLLDSLIKTQRDETDKKLESIRAEASAQKTAAKAEEKVKQPGGLEVTLVHKADPKKIIISLDKEAPVEFMGLAWSKINVPAGQHLLLIKTVTDPPQIIEKIVEVSAGAVTRIEIKFAV